MCLNHDFYTLCYAYAFVTLEMIKPLKYFLINKHIATLTD